MKSEKGAIFYSPRAGSQSGPINNIELETDEVLAGMEEIDIDFVITWVNDEDPDWRLKRSKYLPSQGEDSKPARYRDWGLLTYLFRGFEFFTPWVRKVFLVTDCNPPEWLDIENTKLEIINPNILIPEECVPTFNVNAIESNLHRIPGLSEHFVYFNDDMILLKPLKKTAFFKQGKPCDSAILSPIITTQILDVGSIAVNNMGVINLHFKKKEVIHKHIHKWINYHYGIDNFRTLCVLPWRHLPGFDNPHLPQGFRKSIFEKVWSLEGSRLTEVCQHRFRNYYADINQWLFRYWQLCEGEFVPASKNRGKYFTADQCDRICSEIKKRRKSFICINDSDSIDDITSIRNQILTALSAMLPKPSSFEKQ